ncbi:glycine--tRNA ligase subunit beta [Alkalicoccobacillus murimartini]|uniref:Glycine--tRNA ligase beta subunit n=1 Tax=Alkalicoccobacillus murimartini TaxID=171685 RepID=A0ABT9YCH1_9BACI|nr:glycine--tRNA ligase subunit beta [Alkalicoccobacillus murimartini]MDQ0205549.1 glycyl-tRNA synthetase beta chain [Alkalicoccobacillus murimartini]
MSKHDFLLEIGLEELPARFVTSSIKQLKQSVTAWLTDQRLQFGSVEAYSTPRRLAIIVKDLGENQSNLESEARGPAKKIAVAEDGSWSKAALGFARGQGLSADDLFTKEVKGVEYVFAKTFQEGKKTEELLPELKELITSMHFPKNMRWHDYSLRFARPIQWMVSLYGSQVIPFSITSIETGNTSRGHRFLGEDLVISEPKEYVELLRNQFVVADADERKQMIRSQLEELAENAGWVIPVNEELLEEVNNLVEWPTALSGQFEESFLSLPREVLLTTMKEHQRYFPVENMDGELLAHFITVRNGDANHLENVARGNEKVLRARFSDSAFFFKEDQKLNIDAAVKQLDSIVYHEELGSLGDKVNRIQEIADKLSIQFGYTPSEQELSHRAAKISKFDLVSQMVGEFPELQGLMGEVYASHLGEAEEVATAVREHYFPRFAGDQLPTTKIGLVVSMADKLDTIVSCFAIGLIPTGSQDPYALRRQALGLVQMAVDKQLDTTLDTLLTLAVDTAKNQGLKMTNIDELMSQLREFFGLRMKHAMTDKGIEYDIIDAVLTDEDHTLPWIFSKAALLSEARNKESFKKVVEALSRVTNIAKKAADSVEINPELFEKEEEHQLYKRYQQLHSELKQSKELGQVTKSYEALEQTAPLVDQYFEHIMVMSDQEDVKANRLQLMKQLSTEIEAFALFHKIVF